MKLARITLAIAGVIALSVSSAHAASVLDLTITEEAKYVISGNLVFTLGSESSGAYPITAVSGTISGAGFTEAVTGATCYYGSCLGGGNVLANNSGTYPVVNGFGVSLTLADGSDINIVATSSPYYEVDAYSGSSESAIFQQPFTLTPTISATPLPAALPMFAGGLGLVGFMARRKKRKAQQTRALV
jgi:hypothetical protein